MEANRVIPLSHLRNGESGKVIDIAAGPGMRSKLEALGIRKGVIVTKKSTILNGGPVIVNVGNCELAMGYGMANKVKVEVAYK
ncbi:MAG: FeoA family protein [Clostridia bacterium]|nr:FeoA family protein [Clostridia bacterium]